MSRDAYYKSVRRDELRLVREEKVVKLVKAERQILPRSGGRKILHLIKSKLEECSVQMGRDRFFDILRRNSLLIEPRAKCPKTTYSRHAYAVQPNIFKTLTVSEPGQAAVADITYIRVARAFGYLFLLTDAYSRRIVGWKLSKSLSHKAALEVLTEASGSYESLREIVHHSDRGCQYCCHDFLAELEKKGMVPSMTDADHCAQNAMAERVNGILKDEFYLDLQFNSMEQAEQAVTNAIRVYNSYRPHQSLEFRTPDEVHYENTVQKARA